jgi:hypothetical protein
VTCQYSAGGACTTEEAHLVQIDINKGLVTGPGPDSATNSCYGCTALNSCVDSPLRHQVGFECGDLSGNFTNGSGMVVNSTNTCQAVIDCGTTFTPTGMLCPLNPQGITFCYCGTLGGGSSFVCTSMGSSVNGPCLSQEVAGFKFAQTDASHIVGNFTDVTEPSGQANQFLSCAVMNGCTSCLQ